MISILLIGCYTFRSSIGYESIDQKNHLHISEHLRVSHVYGPTIQLEIAPEKEQWIQQFAVHAEFSLASIAAVLEEPFNIDFGLDEEQLFTQALLLSSLGSNLFHYQHDELSGAKYGLFTPYIMLHTPPLCMNDRSILETSLCFSIHSMHQIQFYVHHTTELRWNIGLSMHYTESLIKKR